MRFYKYPYLSIFIVSYYLLEHQGYYYSLRRLFGYAEQDDVNYLVPINKSAFTQLAKAPDRKFILALHSGSTASEALAEAKKAAKKAKERKCSPVLFGEVDCDLEGEFCRELGYKSPSEIVLVEGGKVSQSLTGEIDKKKILKLMKKATA
mmetsp:Transcript_12965/g.24080  ORF Transcript_12965/g.24080 Transcript_12965/m.24080 type:complete len:150 (+) Transcript_12965:1258-1707(+)